MTRIPVRPEQSFYDEHTLIAQKYAGALVGHNYRAEQQRPSNPDFLHVEQAAWREPTVFADDCSFCKLGLSDEQVTARILGYQAQIDIEVVRNKDTHYRRWLNDPNNIPYITDFEEVPIWGADPEISGRRISIGTKSAGKWDSHANRRTFVVMTQDVVRPNRPDGWRTKPFPMVDLPLRLKRKLCIEWNHLYRDYLVEHPTYQYDFELKEFWREVEPPEPCPVCHAEGIVTINGHPNWVHAATCTTSGADMQNRVRQWYEQADSIERALYNAYFGGVPDNPLSPVRGNGDLIERD